MSDPGGVDEQKVIGQETAAPATKSQREEAKAAADYKLEGKDSQASMRVRVHSPFRSYFDGQALSVSAQNATGPFDILPHHHNFISLLMPCEVVIRTAHEGDRRIRISGGIMHVKADSATVFLDV